MHSPRPRRCDRSRGRPGARAIVSVAVRSEPAAEAGRTSRGGGGGVASLAVALTHVASTCGTAVRRATTSGLAPSVTYLAGRASASPVCPALLPAAWRLENAWYASRFRARGMSSKSPSRSGDVSARCREEQCSGSQGMPKRSMSLYKLSPRKMNASGDAAAAASSVDAGLP